MTDKVNVEQPSRLEERIRKAECASCGGLRNCDIHGCYVERDDDDEEHGFWGKTTWYILKCRGCDYVFTQIVMINSEDYVYLNEEGEDTRVEYNERLAYWPALSRRNRPEWMTDYGIDADNVGDLAHAMREVYGALENDLNNLAVIGVRTCFDIAAGILKVDPVLTFARKLDALVAANHIRQLDRERLEMVVEAGNATAHRGWKPEASHLKTIVDVLEEFVFDVFVQPHRRRTLDEASNEVRAAVPPKPPRRQKRDLL